MSKESVVIITGPAQSGRSKAMREQIAEAGQAVIVDTTGSWLSGKDKAPCPVIDGRIGPGRTAAETLSVCGAMMWTTPGIAIAIDDVEQLGDCRKQMTSLYATAMATKSLLILTMPSTALQSTVGTGRRIKPENREPNRLPVAIRRIVTQAHEPERTTS